MDLMLKHIYKVKVVDRHVRISMPDGVELAAVARNLA
jgi:hypothetical protein